MEAMNLTSNAIAMICDGEIQGGDVKPVLQVRDIKLLSAGQQNNNNNNNERYRMLLSDGFHMQQGMLATQMNSFVKSNQLQKGSVVQLSQFVSQMIQNRKIIIIVELDVILERCDLIGDPKMYGQIGGGPVSALAPQVRTSTRQSSADHSGIALGNPQSIGAPSQSGILPEPNAMGRAALHNTKPVPSNIQSYGSSFLSNPDPRGCSTTNGPSMYPNAEPSARHCAATSITGSFTDQNRTFMNSKPEVGSRAPLNTYTRPQQPTYQHPQAMYSNRGPIAKNEAPARIVPIAALNPYQGRWTVKARVTSKKDLRRFTNFRGEGKVFSFDLLDSDGGEIQVTCFNAVADQFYNMIEAGRVYLISKGMVKPASKNFNHLQNEYAIYLESTSTVDLCVEDDDSIPRQQFHFRSISEIENMENNSILDVIGVVSSISLTASIMKKDGTETLKRSLQLKDMSGRSVELTLWGNFCSAEGQQLQNMCDSGVFPVMAVKAGRITDFNGKSVGTLSTSQLFIEPEFPEALKLREWFDTEGKNKPCVSISRETMGMGRMDVRKTVSQIKDERLGTSEKPDWITVNATISFMKFDNFCYTACPLMVGDRKCSKKVTNNGDCQWQCDRCEQSVSDCDYRYILQFQIQDHTGITWVTAFQECGEEIMGVAAKDLYFLKNSEQGDEKFADIIRGVLFTQYLFKLKVKEETFSDEQRVKSTVVKAEKLDVSSESKFLLDMIDKLEDESVGINGNGVNGVAESGMNSYKVGVKQATSVVNTGVNININSSRDTVVGANHVGQYTNPYNSAREATVGTGVYVYCNSCGATGHNSKNCPSIMSRQGQPMISASYVNKSSPAAGAVAGGSSDECYKCHQSGHWARDCPGSNLSSVYQSGGRYGGVSKQRAGF